MHVTLQDVMLKRDYKFVVSLEEVASAERIALIVVNDDDEARKVQAQVVMSLREARDLRDNLDKLLSLTVGPIV